jgi:hypothetical protein
MRALLSRPRVVVGLVAVLALAQGALGCRHIDVLDAGSAPPGYRSQLIVDYATSAGGRPDGVLVEIHDERGELETRFITVSAGPTRVSDLPPGRHRIRVDARPIGGGCYEEGFDLEPGRQLAIVYDDNQAARDTAAAVARGAGIALLFTVLVAADVALVVLSCGACPPCCCAAVIGR